jgi:hypothetical protein
MFRTILSVNSDYFLKQRLPLYLCNGKELCFLCGTDRIFKYSLDELRPQRVKLLSEFYSSDLFTYTSHSEISHWGRFTNICVHAINSVNNVRNNP